MENIYTEEKLTKMEEECTKIGEKKLSEGKVCLLILCGGQGTRLGNKEPKGTFILPGLGISIFEHHTKKITEINTVYNIKLHCLLMTSKFTHEKTTQFFSKNNYFGLEKNTFTFFKQESVECTDKRGNKIKVREEPTGIEYAMAPNGNGGVFQALKQNNLLKELTEEGIEYINIISVDNVLASICDPTAIGIAFKEELEILSKAVERRENENAGVFKEEGNKIIIREYTEIHTQEKGYANICNHYFSLPFLQKMTEISLPYHKAFKKIPFLRNGRIEEPESPNGYKKELFIFDAFPYADRNKVMLVPRALEFSPLKNGNNSEVDNPLSCVRDICNREEILKNFRNN